MCLKYPETMDVLSKISSLKLNDIFIRLYGEPCDFNKTLADQGIDELGCVELIMEIEKIYNIMIPDEIGTVLFDEYVFPDFYLKELRDMKIDKILG